MGGVHPKCLLSNEIKPRTGTGLVGAPWHWHWGEQGPQVETEPGKIYSLEKNHSVTFRLPPEHTIDPTALFLSSCPVKCNDPEVNVLNFHFHQKAFPSQMSPNSQVYPRPDNSVYVCAGGSKDSLPVPQDPAQVYSGVQLIFDFSNQDRIDKYFCD